MTNLAIYRILNLPERLNALHIYKDTDLGFTEFGFGWAYKLTKYFECDPAKSVNYPAVHYENHVRRDGILTVNRDGDFTFVPARP